MNRRQFVTSASGIFAAGLLGSTAPKSFVSALQFRVSDDHARLYFSEDEGSSFELALDLPDHLALNTPSSTGAEYRMDVVPRDGTPAYTLYSLDGQRWSNQHLS